MSTTTLTHHPAPMAAAAAAVVAIALGGVALSIANDSGNTVVPTDQSNHVLAPPQHGSGHYESTTSGGKVMIGP